MNVPPFSSFPPTALSDLYWCWSVMPGLGRQRFDSGEHSMCKEKLKISSIIDWLMLTFMRNRFSSGRRSLDCRGERWANFSGKRSLLIEWEGEWGGTAQTKDSTAQTSWTLVMLIQRVTFLSALHACPSTWVNTQWDLLFVSSWFLTNTRVITHTANCAGPSLCFILSPPKSS